MPIKSAERLTSAGAGFETQLIGRGAGFVSLADGKGKEVFRAYHWSGGF